MRILILTTMAALASAITVDVYQDPSNDHKTEFAFRRNDTINYGFKVMKECGDGFGVWFFKTANLNKTLFELINSAEEVQVTSTLVKKYTSPSCSIHTSVGGNLRFNQKKGYAAPYRIRTPLLNTDFAELDPNRTFGPLKFNRTEEVQDYEIQKNLFIFPLKTKEQEEFQNPFSYEGIEALCEGVYHCKTYFDEKYATSVGCQELVEVEKAQLNELKEMKSMDFSLKAEVAQLESTVAATKSEDAQLKSEVISLNSKVNSLKSEIEKDEDRLSMHPSKLTNEWCEAHPAFSWTGVLVFSLRTGQPLTDMMWCQLWVNPDILMFIFHPLKDWALFTS